MIRNFGPTIISIAIIGFLGGCSSAEPAPEKLEPVETTPTPDETTTAPDRRPTTSVSIPSSGEAPVQSAATATPKPAAVSARVKEAEKRLMATPSGKKIWAAIEAHGGLETWYSQGPLAFRFNYVPVKKPKVRDTYQVVDTWGSRARHKVRPEENIEFGWDGRAAWLSPANAEPPTNVRFWSLTPYYFVAIPFVLADRGALLADAGQAKIEDKTYDLIKVTFEANVGDAPDDYYIIYLDPETHMVGGLRYVVSYAGFFKDGGHSPEKLMVLKGTQTVQGITFAETYPTYSFDGEKAVEKVTDIALTEVSFKPETPAAFFASPQGAKTLEGY